MQSVLSPAACLFLRKLTHKVAAQGRVKKATGQKTVKEVLSWCLEQQLPDISDNCLKRPEVYFDQALLNNILTAQKALGHPDFRVDISSLSRPEAAMISTIEQKSIGLAPRQLRVLVNLLQPQLCGGLNVQVLDIDWQQLTLSDYDTLLVVENLDCFYQLQRFALELTCQQPLIIYRGDELYSKGCTALKAAWLKLHKPALYFGDCDAKGLSIAVNEGYSAMLLPDIVTLQQQASPAMLPDEQLKFIPALKAKTITHKFLPYLQVVCEQLKGLRQQNMQGILLKPISVN
jgi:hypothetical protein